jgi:SulP family sulfate permease
VPAVAAVLFIVAWGLIDLREITDIVRNHAAERVVLALTFFGTLVDLEKGLFLGIIASLLLYLYRTSQPVVQERVPARERLGDPRRKFIDAGHEQPGCPQLAVLQVRGSLYFGAVEHVRNHFHRVDEIEPRRKWLMVVAQGINFIDLAGAHLLQHESRRRRACGGGLALVAVQPQPWQMFERTGFLAEHGTQWIFAHKGDALRAVYPRLDSEICRHCTVRLFEECRQALPSGEPRQQPAGAANETAAAP